jgi:hypothetical protein
MIINKEWSSNPIKIISNVTQPILRIEIIKESQDRIEKWFILSYPFGASNMRFKQDRINVSYPVSLC